MSLKDDGAIIHLLPFLFFLILRKGGRTLRSFLDGGASSNCSTSSEERGAEMRLSSSSSLKEAGAVTEVTLQMGAVQAPLREGRAS